MAKTRNSPQTRRRRKKFLKSAKGSFGARHRLYKTARETVERAWAFATEHRRTKKRDFRRLWNARISAEARGNGMTYSRFINGLKKAKIGLNRKMLSEMAQVDKPAFSQFD